MLLEREKRMLISGDSIQDGAIFMFGPGRNMPAFQCSLEKISAMADAFDTLLTNRSLSFALSICTVPLQHRVTIL